MEVTTTETKKKSGLLNPKTFVIASIGCLVLAILAKFIPALIEFISLYLPIDYSGFYALSKYITSSGSTLFIGLLLPVSLLLLNKHPEKARLSKLFMLIGALFIVIQILGVFLQPVTLLLLQFTGGYNSVLYNFATSLTLLFNTIPGNQLLASPISFLFMLIDGYWSPVALIISLLSVIFICAAELLLLLSNALATVGFFCAKKDATVEEIAEDAAVEVEETEAPVEA